MTSNFWEEQQMYNCVSEFHEQTLSAMNLPEWIQIKCPNCHNDLPLRAIRSIGIQLNSRNLGDIAVEICCDKCSKLETLYYRQEIEMVEDFVGFIRGTSSPKSEPLTENEMYGARYNNLIEKMIEKEKKVTLYKKGDYLDGNIEVSTMVFVCDDCDITEIVENEDISEQTCKKCGKSMKLISYKDKEN